MREELGFPIGAARSGFAASVARKAREMEDLAVRGEPRREELRRKLRALRSGAESLRLDALERKLGDLVGRLENKEKLGPGSAFERELGELPKLAWGDAEKEAILRTPKATRVAVIVGEPALAEGLVTVSLDGNSYECKSTVDIQQAFDLVRSQAPDVLVVDADLADADALVVALSDDPSCDSIPVVVVGTFAEASGEGKYIALGAISVLKKPMDPMRLRLSCDRAATSRGASETPAPPLGDVTISELARKLGDELARQILLGVDESTARSMISVGRGADVLAPVWGAVARVREVVSARTGGTVVFRDSQRTSLLSPSLELEGDGDARSLATARGAHTDLSLVGKHILVVDDDPAVTWFLSDVFRAAGAFVEEATDGEAALSKAYTSRPDLILSDILMPKLDGLQLCRTIRRDITLRDVPILLLSWKEDLLQRVRELGTQASGFLRKESEGASILGRAREVLRPLSRLEARLLESKEVKGRLDGLTVHTLLELVCRTRPDSRLSLRDSQHFFEVEIRSGRPVRVVRTSANGLALHGHDAMGALLGVLSGRFWVADAVEDVAADFEGSLREIVSPIVTGRRSVLRALSLSNIFDAARVDFDPIVLGDYLVAAPPVVHAIVERLQEGTSPRELLLTHKCDPNALDDVLSGLALRGGIFTVHDADGFELSVPISVSPSKLEAVRTQFRSPEPACVMDAEPAPTANEGGETNIEDTVYMQEGRTTTCIDETLYAVAALLPNTPSERLAEAESDAIEGHGTEMESVSIMIDGDVVPSISIAQPVGARSDSVAPISVDDVVTGRTSDRQNAARGWALAIAFAGLCAGAAFFVRTQWVPTSSVAGSAVMEPVAPVAEPVVLTPSYEGDARIHKSTGQLVIETDRDTDIRVDDNPVERGHRVELSLTPGYHKIARGAEVFTVDVRAMQRARVRLP